MYKWIPLAVAALAILSPANAKERLIIAVDLDNTCLFTDVRDSSPAQRLITHGRGELMRIYGKEYRVATAAAEIIGSLPSIAEDAYDVEIGFYSAHGNAARNHEAVRLLVEKSGNRIWPAFVISGNEALRWRPNETDTQSYVDAQPKYAIFRGNEKKDLTRIPNSEGASVIIIDDTPSIMMRGQEKSLLWVRRSAPPYELLRARAVLDLAVHLASAKRVPLLEALWHLQWGPEGANLRYNGHLARPEVYFRGAMLVRDVFPEFVLPWIPDEYFPEAALGWDDSISTGTAPKAVPVETPVGFSWLPRWFRRAWESEEPAMKPEVTGLEFRMTPKEFRELEPPGDLPTYDMRIGSHFNVPGLPEMTVKGLVSQDDDKRFFLAVGPDDAHYGVRVAKTSLGERSLEEKAALYEGLAGAALPHPTILKKTRSYLIQKWIEGETAEAWSQSPFTQGDPKWESFMWMVQRMNEEGVYVEQFRPSGTVWNGKSWVIVKAKEVNTGYSSSEIASRLSERLPRRWNAKGCALQIAAEKR